MITLAHKYIKMKKITKVFTVKELNDFGLPYNTDDSGEDKTSAILISEELVGKSRWGIIREIVFRLPGQNKNEAYKANYSVGTTKQQYEDPWQYQKIVECILVHEIEKVVKVWKDVYES